LGGVVSHVEYYHWRRGGIESAGDRVAADGFTAGGLAGPSAALGTRLSSARPPTSRLRHLAQVAGLDVVYEAADRVRVGNERARLDPRDRPADVLIEIVEGFQGEG
jgi:hypothetical protein